MTVKAQKPIVIFRGDNTAAFDLRTITILLTGDLDLSHATAKFTLLNFSKTWTEQEVATGELSIVFDSAQTKSFALGPQVGTLRLYDMSTGTPRQLTVVNKIPFFVTNNVCEIDSQSYGVNVRVTSGDVINIEFKVGAGAVEGKADKVTNATTGDLASLAADGNLEDSGIPKTDVLRKSQMDSTPTAGSQNPVTSDGIKQAIDAATPSDYAQVKAQVEQNATDISAINGKIPAQASAQNQLADKSFVNSSIATNTATFRGTYNLVTDLSLTTSATHEQVAAAIKAKLTALSITQENNDYCFVQVPKTDEEPAVIERIDRYKCTVTESGGVTTRVWEYEWSLNNSSFTADQWAAINSGITSALVAKLGALPTADELAASLLAKYEKPPTGIPKTDLSAGVQASLDKADSALQTAPVTSVNGKTGAVSLTASDVGALGKTGNQNMNGSLSFWAGNLRFTFMDAAFRPVIEIFNGLAVFEFPTQSGTLALRSEIPSIAGLATKQETINIIALTDGTETMAQFATRLAALATSGVTAYFDTSAITTTPQSKLVSALIDTTAGKIRFDDKLTGRIYIGPYDATMTLATVLSRMVESYVYLAVTATTLDGVTVTGQTVSLYEGTDAATGRLVETAAYNGSPVTFMVPRNMEYFISITSTLAQHFQPNTLQGTASASASLTITYQDVSNITDYAGLVAFKDVVEADTSISDKAAYLESILLGKEIADTFTATNGTVYDNPMVVVGANYYTGEDNQQHLGIMMQRKWASSYDTQFDEAEGVECDSATETTAEDGISYYGLALGKTSKAAADLTLLELATGATLPYSDYAKIYKNAVRDTTRNILQYGYNNWRDSAYRQHLNSSAAAGAWWTATHVGDVAPSNLNSVRGYMAGCSSALLAAAKKVKIKTWPNYITDGANSVSTVYETLDTFFLPSISEMYGSSNRDGVFAVEGYLSDYWKEKCELENPSDAANANRIQYRELVVGSTATRSAASVRLRSAARGYSYHAWFVYTSGQVNYYYTANSAIASVPACVIY